MRKDIGFVGKTAVVVLLLSAWMGMPQSVYAANDNGIVETPEIPISGGGGQSGSSGSSSSGTSGSTADDVETPAIDIDMSGGGNVVDGGGYIPDGGYVTGGGSSYSGGYYTGGGTYYSGSDSSSSYYDDSSSESTNSVWVRYGGSDRFETASKMVAATFDKCDFAVIATGSSFPDALTASAVAGAKGCPVLLTDGRSLSPQVSQQLERLGVKEAFIMGGTGSVSESVEQGIASRGVTVRRIAGADRVSTSVAALREARAQGSNADTIILATGDGFADALSIGSWSYSAKAPIVLVRSGKLSDEAVSAIRGDAQIKRIVIVGGEAVVPDAVKTQLGDGYEYVRLAGADRYATSRAIADWVTQKGLTDTKVCVATGANFPDALAGAAVAGKKGGVLLLEDGTGSVARWLQGRHASVKNGYVLGGVAAVSDAVMAGLPR